MGQLSFVLPHREALDRGNFFVSPSNANAVTLINRFSKETGASCVLTGPAGAGKTHLTHVWAKQSDGQILNARDLGTEDVPRLARGSIAVEDVPEVASDAPALAALFHLFNQLRSNGCNLLMTGRGTAFHWKLALPDLQSRINAAQSISLGPPDDALLAAILAKLFVDRQLAPRPDVIPYLVARMERSYEAAQYIVAKLDHAALLQRRTVTRAFVSETLSNSDFQT